MSAGESGPLRDDTPKRPAEMFPPAWRKARSRMSGSILDCACRSSTRWYGARAKPRCAGRQRRCGGPEWHGQQLRAAASRSGGAVPGGLVDESGYR